MSQPFAEVLSSSSLREESGRGVLASLSLSMLLSSLGTSIANVALPTLEQSFDARFQTVQWVVLAYLLSVTTLTVVAGRLGDVAGTRRLFLTGIALFSLSSAAGGVAPALPVLIVARGVQGIGAAIMMALTVALVTETVPKAKTGSAMGVLGTTSAIGTALGPSLGGALIALSGWRAVFLVQSVAGAIAFLLALTCLPRDERRFVRDGRPFDLAGTVLLALTLGAYVLAVTLGRGSFGAINATLLTCAALGAVLFVFAERRVESPLIRFAMLRNATLASSLAMSVLVSTVVMAILVVGPFYLSRALRLDAAMVGLVLSAGPLVAAVTGVPAGRLVDRFGAARVTLAGLAGIACGAIALAFLPPSGVIGFVVPIAVITASYALFQTANNTAVMRDAGSDRGVVAGMLNLSRNIGLLTGASVMGAIFARAAATLDPSVTAPNAMAFGFRFTFGLAGALVMLAIALAIRARRADGST